jgi:lipopolysaccharide export system protein LptA
MKSLPTITVLALALVAAHPAAAQLSQGKGPVDITSDQLETGNNDCVSTWRGNVEALQDTARMRTDVLKMYFQKGSKPGASGGSCGDLLRMEAEGSVYYVSPQQRVHGDNAIYEAASDTLTVTGDVVAVQGQNVLRGERMVINTQTGQGHMVGSAQGRNKPGRVRGVFYPNQSNNPQSNQPSAPSGQRR